MRAYSAKFAVPTCREIAYSNELRASSANYGIFAANTAPPGLPIGFPVCKGVQPPPHLTNGRRIISRSHAAV